MAELQQRQYLHALWNGCHLTHFVVEGRATGKQLGIGSYGSVEEIEVNGLICAGKRIHEVLIDADNDGIESITRRYVQECQLMSDLRHPNITLFLGVCFLPDCQLPVLLMERLDGSLDDLLENISDIPLPLKRSILEDISRGLLYLHKHTPQVIHRDLTAKNVLLNSYFIAKITDLGNSRIVNLQPGQLARTLSRIPGTLVYMPPEALSPLSCYGPSLDIFSFGHLALFTLLQVFPGDLLEPNYANPDNPEQLLACTEVEQRQVYFDQLKEETLIPLIKSCLHNSPSRRPTAEQLVASLEEARSTIEGTYGELATVDAVRQLRTIKALKKRSKEKMKELIAKDEEIQHLQHQLEATSKRFEAEIHQKDEDIHQMSAQLNLLQVEITRVQADLQQKDLIIQQKDIQLNQLRETVQQREAQLQQRNKELQQRNTDIRKLQRELKLMKTPLSELNLPLRLKWRRGKDLPFGMLDYPKVVVLEEKVYIGGGFAQLDREAQTVVVYDPKQDSYDALPPYACKWFSMVVVNNHLVLVGGQDVCAGERTNRLGMWNEQSKRWTHPLPPMIIACNSPSVATYQNRWLVVIGGYDGKNHLSRVEILKTTEPGQWYCSTSLPQPCSHAVPAVIGNMCYLLGGYTNQGAAASRRASRRVFSVHLDDIISQQTTTSDSHAPSPWQSLPDIPLVRSTALIYDGALVAVGGCRGSTLSTAIYHFQPGSRSWIKAGELPTARSHCGCTVLPSGKLYVAGGGVFDESVAQSIVDIASV